MQDATLCYVFEDEEVLLIRKKRGPGEGRYVGPGGKVEANESIEEAVIREVHEETSLTIDAPEKKGELAFYFAEEPFMNVHVFRAESYTGTVEESDEAEPDWMDITDLPYDRMWDGDEHWLPLLIDGESFSGTFTYDEHGDELREHTLTQPAEFDSTQT